MPSPSCERGCPDRNQLLAFSRGELPEDQLLSVAAHLGVCPACLAEVDRHHAGRSTVSRRSGTPSANARPSSDVPHRDEPECRRMLASVQAIKGGETIHILAGEDLQFDSGHPVDAQADTAVHSQALTVQRANAARQPASAPLLFPVRYELRSILGQGGFGVVYEALDSELNRDVAIKVLREDRRSEGDVTQFREEARKLAQIRHPAVLNVYDVGRAGNRWFLVTELVRGGTLLDRINTSTLSIADAVRIVAEVAEGLHVAHLQGIIHRDIKPANILMEESGQPRLTDFGLAVTEEEQLREASSHLGTLPYMAPEQIRGESRFLDARSDVYALGNVLYFALTGRLPFLGKTLEDYQEQICDRLPRPPRTIRDDIPSDVEQVCLKCLAKDPEQRYTTAADLAADLRTALNQIAPSRVVPPPVGPRRNWPAWIGLVATSLLLLILTAGYLGVLSASSAATASRAFEEPYVWHDLLRKPPVEFRPLSIADSRWIYDSDRRDVLADTRAGMLLGLGETKSDWYVLQVGLSKTAWAGNGGFFIGLREGPPRNGRQTWTCEAFNINCLEEGGLLLEHEELELVAFQQTYSMSRRRVAAANIEAVALKDVILEITVLPDNTVAARWNGRPVEWIVSDPGRPIRSRTGQFGLLNKFGTTVFRNATYKNLRRPPLY